MYYVNVALNIISVHDCDLRYYFSLFFKVYVFENCYVWYYGMIKIKSNNSVDVWGSVSSLDGN